MLQAQARGQNLGNLKIEQEVLFRVDILLCGARGQNLVLYENCTSTVRASAGIYHLSKV